ncbi:hypothetical protein DPMN_180121 [Dreissena polymorpha]|uniref:Uncharacterized protein n=1 Tax=Dreissena polymorpha TaxID=45954 RepID=A0A9D4EFA4_DREPO|nr:hypothetical protein DPMN_180121 [Dreissena polymorpha]
MDHVKSLSTLLGQVGSYCTTMSSLGLPCWVKWSNSVPPCQVLAYLAGSSGVILYHHVKSWPTLLCQVEYYCTTMSSLDLPCWVKWGNNVPPCQVLVYLAGSSGVILYHHVKSWFTLLGQVGYYCTTMSSLGLP